MHDDMKVSGTCDAGCGKPATRWFGETACATCDDSACVNVMQDSYDRERPFTGPPGEHPQKAVQLRLVAQSVALLDLVITPRGASFVLGEARGRLSALRDLRVVSEAETAELSNNMKDTFDLVELKLLKEGTLWAGVNVIPRQTELLQQYEDVLSKVPGADESGVCFYLGVTYGVLMNLRDTGFSEESLAHLEGEANEVFDKHWPGLRERLWGPQHWNGVTA
jgi:hypothetical protein